VSTVSTLSLLGWGEPQQCHLDSIADSSLIPARVASVDRGALTVLGALAEPLAPVVVPHRAAAGIEAPAVGDWAVLRSLEGGAWGVVGLLLRTSLFVRKEAGRGSSAQTVAANVDRVLVVTAVGEDLSPGRIERYVTAIHAGGALAVVVVNKSDRPHDVEAVLAAVRSAAPGTPVVRASALSEGGLDELLGLVPPPMTVALVGSSGVGKTSILNRLLGGGAHAAHATSEVRSSDDKGRHTTTRRELVVAPSGLLVIDTPGVREIGLWDASAGIGAAFPDIVELAATCRFSDCAHDSEPGCALRAAIEQGSLPADRAARYERLLREIAHNDARSGARVHEQKKRWKAVHVEQRERQKLSRKLGFKG
jgi:ribosome biogenesis GTPase